MLEETPCVICKKEAKIKLENFNGYREKEKFDIYYCSFCNTSFVWPQEVDSKIYDSIYSQADFVPGYNRYALYASEIKNKKNGLKYLAGKEAMYFAVKKILTQNIAKSDKILEVGSGLGYLTYAARQEGYNVTGLDISADAIKKASARFGNYYVCEDVYHYALKNIGKFGVVILTEVIEHVPGPSAFVDALMSLLKPGGKLIISTPNKSAYPSNEYWNTELPPVHLTWLSEDSFKAICLQKNFSVSFFDFSDFNKRHFDFTKYRYYESYSKKHTRIPTLNSKGEVLTPKNLVKNNSLPGPALKFKEYFKSIIERIIMLSPLTDKKHFERNPILCAVLQNEANKI